MSAPTPAPGDDRPREGYYPDPSIPGYVRYWNGGSWVPGTSRPAPSDGEPLAPPPGSGTGSDAGRPVVEETGPHFFDEDPVDGPGISGAQHGSRPEPAAAWGADRSRQSGFGGDQDRRVSWGSPEAPRGEDPRVRRAADPADGPARPDGHAARADGTATIPPAGPAEPGESGAAAGNTFVFRRPTPGPAATGVPGPGPDSDDGTMTFRALSPRTAQQGEAAGAHPGSTGVPATGGPAFGNQGPAASPGGPGSPAGSGFGAGKAAAARAAASGPSGPSGPQSAPATAAPGVPQQFGPQSGPQPGSQPGPQPGAQSVPQSGQPGPQPGSQSVPPSVPGQGVGGGAAAPVGSGSPMAGGAGGGQPSWAQQVHQLAGASGDEQPVVPWKPPTEDVFQAAARRQASARPAALGKRLAARLVDTLVLAGVTAVAAVPLGTRAIDHVNEKIDEAKLSGETVTVWLLDGTTSVYLGIVLAVLLLFGALYEALPTAKWGRTLGKKLLGLEVRDIEGNEPPSFGAALRRWFVYSVPGLLAVGVLGLVWGLFDKPWRQCWHDKVAHTFVAG